MVATIEEQKIAIEIYNRLVSLRESVTVEFDCNGNIEFRYHSNSNLRGILKDMRLLGIHKIDKKEYCISNGQYAIGYNLTNTVRVRVSPKNETFDNCRYETYVEEVTVKAKNAVEAIPEHIETITKKRLICSEYSE